MWSRQGGLGIIFKILAYKDVKRICVLLRKRLGSDRKAVEDCMPVMELTYAILM